MGKLNIFISLVIIALIAIPFSLAVDDIIALQGNVKQDGVDVSSGNLTITIWDAQSGGNVIYNSTTDFNNAVSSGKYDVMVGNGTNELSLEYGQTYFIELFVNGELFTFDDGSTRQIFQSSIGQINGTYVNSLQINASHLTADVSQWLYNQSSPYDAFNYNMSAVTDITQWLYNQSAVTDITTWLYNQTNAGDTRFLRLTNAAGTGVNVTGNFLINATGDVIFNGGWQNDGVTISQGDIYAQTIFVYNISSLEVNTLSLNGSILPPNDVNFNNTFDIGSGARVWNEGYFGEDVWVENQFIKKWLYNQSLSPTITTWLYNQSIPYDDFNYNMSSVTDITTWLYNQSLSPTITTWLYNQTSASGWFDSGTTVSLVTSTDSVGIGTVSPGSRLHVSGGIEDIAEIYATGTGVGTTTIRLLNITSTVSDDNGITYGIYEFLDGNGGLPQSAQYGYYADVQGTNNDYGLYIENADRNYLVGNTNLTGWLNATIDVCTTSGKCLSDLSGSSPWQFNSTDLWNDTSGVLVGIGTNNGVRQLNVLNDIQISTDGLGWLSTDGLQLLASSGNASIVQAENLPFGIATNGVTNYRIWIEGDGDIGIGTTTPSSILDIYTGSSSDGVSIRGATPASEIGALWVRASGAFVFDATKGTGTQAYVDFMPEDDQLGLILRRSDGVATTPYANFYVVEGGATDYLSIVVSAVTGTGTLNVMSSGDVGFGVLPDADFQVQVGSDALGIASGAVTPNIANGAGDLYVADDLEIDGVGSAVDEVYLCISTTGIVTKSTGGTASDSCTGAASPFYYSILPDGQEWFEAEFLANLNSSDNEIVQSYEITDLTRYGAVYEEKTETSYIDLMVRKIVYTDDIAFGLGKTTKTLIQKPRGVQGDIPEMEQDDSSYFIMDFGNIVVVDWGELPINDTQIISAQLVTKGYYIADKTYYTNKFNILSKEVSKVGDEAGIHYNFKFDYELKEDSTVNGSNEVNFHASLCVEKGIESIGECKSYFTGAIIPEFIESELKEVYQGFEQSQSSLPDDLGEIEL